ncbi:MAG TPA: cytochrome c-type biogenesis protein [Nitrospiria bacterium]
MMVRIPTLVILFIFFLAVPVQSAPLEEDELELEMRAIAKTLRCAVCQNESIWESQAGLARQMRGVIRDRLKQGESPEEIRAYFLSRYGDYILLAPRKTGVNMLLWIGPFILLVIGGVILYRSVSRWVKESSEATPDEVPVVDEALHKRVQEAIRSEEEED